MKKLFSVLMLFVVFLSGCGSSSSTSGNTKITSEWHDQLLANERVKTTTTLTQPDERYVVYFTQASCHACEEINDQVQQKLSETQTPFYVYDIVSYNIDGTVRVDSQYLNSQFYKSGNKISSLTLPMPVTDDINVSSTPTMFLIENGQIVDVGVGIGSEAGKVGAILDQMQ